MSTPLKDQKSQSKIYLFNKYLTPPYLLSIHHTFASLQGKVLFHFNSKFVLGPLININN